MGDRSADEIKWTWSQYPASRLEAARMIVPLACTYAPLAPLQSSPFFDPQRCRTCQGILNPHCQCDFRSLIWVCPLCGTNNNFPREYSAMNENNLPLELQQHAVEYTLRQAKGLTPFYLFVIDLCVGSANKRDMDDLRNTLLKAINFLPSDATVGVMTFGTAVSVHELVDQSGSDLPGKIMTLKGSKSYTSQQVAQLLRLNAPGGAPNLKEAGDCHPYPPGTVPNCFFAKLSDVEVRLTELFDGLEPDPWPVAAGFRQRRCTGAALSVASALTDILYPGSGGRIMLFLSGPCTEGPGICVDPDQACVMRQHSDIKGDTNEAKYWLKSRAFFDELAQKLIRNGHCVDAFLNALDQVGYAEMNTCVASTGGTCLLADSYSNPKFVDSFRKFFNRDADGLLPSVYNARLEVQTSAQWKIAGAIGPMNSTKKKTSSLSTDTEYGVGGTTEWLMPSLDPRTHIAFYFEVANTQRPGSYRFVQFTTKYQHYTGEMRLRVTTACHHISSANARIEDFVPSFDQYTSAVLMARLASFKAEEGHVFDVLRWLDGHLIKLVSRFGSERDKPSNLTLAPQMSLFPQFMFHLRRSQFLQVFNSSPDETCFCRLWLNRESSQNSLVMIQPALFAYDNSGGPMPVLLDSSSVQTSNILLLDTYFEVVIHYGEVIASWRDSGYHENPEYEYFARLLQQPKEEAMKIVRERYPQPRFVECDHHGSQARLLYNVVNPSNTHNQKNEGYGQQQGEIVYTDDASLQTFLERLKEVAIRG